MVTDFGQACKRVDAMEPRGGSVDHPYKPGIGPLEEDDAVSRVLMVLKEVDPLGYGSAVTQVTYRLGLSGAFKACDLVIPGEWAIEFKMIRPYGDNGKESDYWLKNLLFPYHTGKSSISDCIKLKESGRSEQKAIVVFGYEHDPPKIAIEVAVRAFEAMVSCFAGQEYGFYLGPRCSASFDKLIHPVHQQGKVFGWEVI
jgi:hypothetical protein